MCHARSAPSAPGPYSLQASRGGVVSWSELQRSAVVGLRFRTSPAPLQDAREVSVGGGESLAGFEGAAEEDLGFLETSRACEGAAQVGGDVRVVRS